MSLTLLIIFGIGLLMFAGLIALIVVLVTKPKARKHAQTPIAPPANKPALTSIAPTSPAPVTRAPQVPIPEKQISTTAAAPLPYARIPNLMSAAERDFYQVLQSAVPDGFVLFAQVRLANLIRPTSRNPKQNKYDFYRIQAKCVDFVLCDAATTAPRLVVELDDASHNRDDRKARDSFVDAVLAHVNLPVLHVRWQRSYSQEQLASDIRQALGLRPALSTDRAADRAVEKALAWKADTVPPIAVAPAPATVPVMMAVETSQVKPGVVDAPVLEQRWACGQCHQPVRKEAVFCQHCGATLGAK